MTLSNLQNMTAAELLNVVDRSNNEVKALAEKLQAYEDTVKQMQKIISDAVNELDEKTEALWSL